LRESGAWSKAKKGAQISSERLSSNETVAAMIPIYFPFFPPFFSSFAFFFAI
jgi:hypothetical protein